MEVPWLVMWGGALRDTEGPEASNRIDEDALCRWRYRRAIADLVLTIIQSRIDVFVSNTRRRRIGMASLSLAGAPGTVFVLPNQDRDGERFFGGD